jgi:hypothetical protein
MRRRPTHAGEREVTLALRKTLFKYRLRSYSPGRMGTSASTTSGSAILAVFLDTPSPNL